MITSAFGMPGQDVVFAGAAKVKQDGGRAAPSQSPNTRREEDLFCSGVLCTIYSVQIGIQAGSQRNSEKWFQRDVVTRYTYG